MVLLFVDALVISAIILVSVLVIREMIRKNNKNKLEEALFRQAVAEDLAKQVDRLDTELVRQHEKKIKDKLDGLH